MPASQDVGGQPEHLTASRSIATDSPTLPVRDVPQEIRSLIRMIGSLSEPVGRGLGGLLVEKVYELASRPDALQLVCELIRTGNGSEQAGAIRTLQHFHIDPSVSVPLLERSLHDGDAPMEAARALGRYGARGLLPLVAAARAESSALRSAGLTGLAVYFSNDDILDVVLEGLSADDEDVRRCAINALAGMSKGRNIAVSKAVNSQALHTTDYSSRELKHAINRLVEPATTTLSMALHSRNADMRKSAAEQFPHAIGLSDHTAGALSHLAINDPSEDVRVAALLAIGQIGLDAGQGLSRVLATLAAANGESVPEQVRSGSILVQEGLRESLAPLVGVPRVTVRVKTVMQSLIKSCCDVFE